jgi:L-ascorbate metabolism protein UlaG (beta-lactamase superfamily)
MAAAAYKMAPQFFSRVSEDLKRPVLAAPNHPNVADWPAAGLHAAWLGHSTTWINVDGFTILTDPVFSERIGLNVGPVTLGIKRLVKPALFMRELPRPDLILLSHAHMDHFDIPSLRRLEDSGSSVVTAVKTSDLLRVERYGKVQEVAWNEEAQVGPATIKAIQVKHWGARMRSDTYRGYNAYLIEVSGRRIVFGGDTAYTDAFRQVRGSRPVDLAIMPIGAYNPWIGVHCNPEQALAMAGDAGAECVLPVHHLTFELSSEPQAEPMERILEAAGNSSDRIVCREIGAEWHAS